MREHKIYKITSPSGKVYIGQSKNIENRKLNYKWTGKQTSRQPIFHKSLVKYGFENHAFEVIESNLSKQEANTREKYHIKIYKELGCSLNCTDGGNSVSFVLKRPVIKFDLKGSFIKEYSSIIDAANELKIIPQKIQICLSKKRFYSSGFLWLYKSDYEKGVKPIWNQSKSSRKKIILQINKYNKEVINEFHGATEAFIKTNIKKGSILNCLCNSSKSAGGYIWKYKQL